MVSRRRITPPVCRGLSNASAGTRRRDLGNSPDESADRTIQAVALASWENEGGSGAVQFDPEAPVRLLGHIDFEQKNAAFCEDMPSVDLGGNEDRGG